MTWEELNTLMAETRTLIKNTRGGEAEKNNFEIELGKLEALKERQSWDAGAEILTLKRTDQTKLRADFEVLRVAVEEDRTSGGSWKGILGSIVKTVTGMIPGVGGLIGAVTDKVLPE